MEVIVGFVGNALSAIVIGGLIWFFGTQLSKDLKQQHRENLDLMRQLCEQQLHAWRAQHNQLLDTQKRHQEHEEEISQRQIDQQLQLHKVLGELQMDVQIEVLKAQTEQASKFHEAQIIATLSRLLDDPLHAKDAAALAISSLPSSFTTLQFSRLLEGGEMQTGTFDNLLEEELQAVKARKREEERTAEEAQKRQQEAAAAEVSRIRDAQRRHARLGSGHMQQNSSPKPRQDNSCKRQLPQVLWSNQAPTRQFQIHGKQRRSLQMNSSAAFWRRPKPEGLLKKQSFCRRPKTLPANLKPKNGQRMRKHAATLKLRNCSLRRQENQLRS